MSTPSHELARKVWDTLSKLDVTRDLEYMKATAKRPAVRYLPWHRAWALAKDAFPSAYYIHKPDVVHPDHTMEVEVTVIFTENENQYAVTCRLGVMDKHFNALVDPNAREINDSRQRCLTKALALAGLGLNLWSDSDVPVGVQGKPINDEQAAKIKDLLEKTKSNTEKFLKWVGTDSIEDIPYEMYSLAESQLKKKLEAQELQ